MSGPSTFSLPDAVDVLERTPAVLRALLDGLPLPLLHARERPDAWSPLQVVAHLAWGEVDDWMPRVQRLLTHGTTLAFAPFDREAGFERYKDWPVEELLAEFARRRRESLEELRGLQLTAGDLARRGRHPTFGDVTLAELLATWVTHDFAHLAQITRTLTRAQGAHVGPWRQFFSLLQ